MGHLAIPQKYVIGVKTVWPLTAGAGKFGGLYQGSDDGHDRISDPVLKLENILGRSVMMIGPQMHASSCFDQLRCNPEPVARFANAAFLHIAHSQLAADMLDVNPAALVAEAGIAGDDEQSTESRQRSYDVFDHAIGKVVLLCIATHVLKGPNRDRRLIGQIGWGL